MNFSFEILPPPRWETINDVKPTLSELVEFNPTEIAVTTHAHVRDKKTGVVVKKRPGTHMLCAVIQHEYNVPTRAHILRRYFDDEETEDYLRDLYFANINKVLAITGDDKGALRPHIMNNNNANQYSLELVKQIVNMNNNVYISKKLVDTEPTNFEIGIACYPEGHLISQKKGLTLEDEVHNYVLPKVEAGANSMITQMFFDNQHFLNFNDVCNGAGINIPLIPGIKILSNKDVKNNNLKGLTSLFNVSIPKKLETDLVQATSYVNSMQIGVEHAANQVEELYDAGMKDFHIFIMGPKRLYELKKFMKRI